MRKVALFLFFFMPLTLWAKDYWVYIKPTDSNVEGRSDRGDIVDIIPADRGTGKCYESKTFLIVKMTLTEEDIKKMMTPLENDDDEIKESERRYKFDISSLKKVGGFTKNTGAVLATVDFKSVDLVERRK